MDHNGADCPADPYPLTFLRTEQSLQLSRKKVIRAGLSKRSARYLDLEVESLQISTLFCLNFSPPITTSMSDSALFDVEEIGNKEALEIQLTEQQYTRQKMPQKAHQSEAYTPEEAIHNLESLCQKIHTTTLTQQPQRQTAKIILKPVAI